MHNVSEFLGDAVDFFHVKSSRAEKFAITFYVFSGSKASICRTTLLVHHSCAHDGFFVKERSEQFPVVIARRAGQHVIHLIDNGVRVFERWLAIGFLEAEKTERASDDEKYF